MEAHCGNRVREVQRLREPPTQSAADPAAAEPGL